MEKKYLPVHSATISTDHLGVVFYRLYEDTRTAMCDSLKPEWSPLDDFIIEITGKQTTRHQKCERVNGVNCMITRTDTRVFDKFTIRTQSKQAANYIWYLAKHEASFYDIQDMHEAKQF